MLQVLSEFWDKFAVELSPFETLSLVDWTFNYDKMLKKFGIRMDSLYLGFEVLCNAYARKIYSTLMDKFVHILYQDSKEATAIEEEYDSD